MRFTNAQLDLLKECNAKYGDDWSIEEVDNGNIRLLIHLYMTGRSFERYIDVEGTVKRWDDDTGSFQPASFVPLKGSYNYKAGSGIVAKEYNY